MITRDVTRAVQCDKRRKSFELVKLVFVLVNCERSPYFVPSYFVRGSDIAIDCTEGSTMNMEIRRNKFPVALASHTAEWSSKWFSVPTAVNSSDSPWSSNEILLDPRSLSTAESRVSFPR